MSKTRKAYSLIQIVPFVLYWLPFCSAACRSLPLVAFHLQAVHDSWRVSVVYSRELAPIITYCAVSGSPQNPLTKRILRTAEDRIALQCSLMMIVVVHRICISNGKWVASLLSVAKERGITFSSIPETWNWRPESSITEHGIRIDYLSEIHGVNARAENKSINRSR